MKNQINDQSLDETTHSMQQQLARKCPSSNSAIFICCNKNCGSNAYICGDESCKCFQNHDGCPHLSIKSVFRNLHKKIIPFQHFQSSILDKIDQTIDKLSLLKQKLSSQIQKDLTLYGLTQKDKNLFNALNQQKITAKQFFLSFNQAINLKNQFIEKESLDKKIAEIWKCVDTEIIKKSSQLYKTLQQIKSIKQETKDQFIDIKMLRITSKVLTTEQSSINLLRMFGDKVPQSFKLLYRASENNFSTDKFHEKCDKIAHTLTLCETVDGKVIGGYTPLIWDKPKQSQLQKDESGSSFIFSLTNNDKFTLDKSKDAIYQVSNIGPTFGNGQPDFYLNNSADKNNSYADLNKSYINQNYNAGNGESFMKFTGNPNKSYNFKAKQWQVWELNFKP